MSRKQPKYQTFLDRYLAGKARREEIDDYVDAWHENPEQMELHEFLGMSQQEYAWWLRNPDALDEIALARKTHGRVAGEGAKNGTASGDGAQREPARSGGDVLIVDNSDSDWKVRDYLREWTEIAHTFDIATGSFEIGALLALDGHWQKLDKIRILMGDQVSKTTKKALLESLVTKAKATLDQSIESEKTSNDFLEGVPAIVDAMRTGQIESRVYIKDRFHAKAYITHAKLAVIGSSALVGSSNFTLPGLTQNVELNIQLRREVELLQEWFERHWSEAENISDELLKTVERHIREYQPFEVYVKALQEYFRNHEITVGEWEQSDSKMFPVLDQYQKEGYSALIKIADQYGGAFLCDGVGLGKTFVGMMLIERLIMHDRKRVMLLVPKAARKPVWEAAFSRYLPGLKGDFSNLVIFNHTDLNRGGEYQERFQRMKELADVIVIDEAHHFRNPGVRAAETLRSASSIKPEEDTRPSRYWRLFDIAEGKTLFLLTATPVNNSLLDFQHMIELFSRRQPDYFRRAPLGIQSLSGHIRKMEKELLKMIDGAAAGEQGPPETNEVEAERVLSGDALFRALVVQRSRAYVRESQKQAGGSLAIFPHREDPKVQEYSIKKAYGRLLEMFEKAFSNTKPLFSLAMYYPLAYYKGENKSIDPFVENRQKQVVGLIRTLFLKRFESSARAFEFSCELLLLKLLAFMTKNSKTTSEKQLLERWKAQNAELIGFVQEHQLELFGGEEADEDVIPDELLESVEELSRDEYKVEEILNETILDMDQIAKFLQELKKFKPSQDDKLQALIRLLKTDKVLKNHKVLIFSEFMATARYLKQELTRAKIQGVEEVDSTITDRGEVIRQFAPYYNGSSSAQLAKEKLPEIRVLISTDVLSEGLNLQDATRLINYDLHWNPVRLMQRIGRVDRRMNPEVEERIVADHPEQKSIRGNVAFWNFLPPDELNTLLTLYQHVSHKTLRISKIFGIEGKKLLKPDDDFDALKDFTHAYEGTTTPVEKMHLEYQKLLQDYPDLKARIDALPGRVFSGKAHPRPGARAVFFCYALPAPPGPAGPKTQNDANNGWSLEEGATRWYLYDLDTGNIMEDASEIAEFIRSLPETPRQTMLDRRVLTETRMQIERHIKNTYLRQVQAPVGVKPLLKAWMELN
jgi:SNF2 family DNA or RNA helicase